MAKATTSIVIYRSAIKAIVATVNVGDNYYLAQTDLLFNGTVEEFTEKNSDYKPLNEVLEKDFRKIP